MRRSIEQELSYWRQRGEDLGKLEAQVRATTLISEFECSLRRIADADEELVNLSAAAKVSGYSSDQLRRMSKSGKLQNFGRRHSPKFRCSDLPKKPTPALRSGDVDEVLDRRRRMAAAVHSQIIGGET